jgi:hypothetical protein
MADDPLSSLLGDGERRSGKGLFDGDDDLFSGSKGDSRSMGEEPSSVLKSVAADKFANKASVQKQKIKVEQQAAADKEARERKGLVDKGGGANKALEKGLGFSVNPEVSGSSGDARLTDLKDFDLLENLADKEKLNDLQESIFATLAGDEKKKESDDLFGTKTKKGGTSSSSSGGSLRLGRQLNETKIDDLGSATSFLEKETDDELNYDVFGVSKTKQAVKKQAVTIESNAEAVQKELGSIGIGDEEALNKLDSLTQESSPSLESRSGSKKPPTSTAGVAAPAEVVTDIDMDNLDLDAYISSMTGGGAGGEGSSSGGGGLFD